MTKSIIISILLCLGLLFITPKAKSDVDLDSLKIELITIGAGEYYWEAFGHSALRIKTDTQDYMFGFGYFDFSEEDFFLKFAKGETRYFLGIDETDFELDDYKKQGRKIWIQNLQLSAPQKKELIDKLNFLSRPENRYYHYDYFLNNCTSRIRDILDEVTNGEIFSQLGNTENKLSWNDLTFPVTNQAWMNLGIAWVYGLPAYFDRDQWQLSVFPEDFSRDLKELETRQNWNKSFQVYYQPTAEESSFNHYGFFKTHYAMLLCVSILLLALMISITKKTAINFWLIFQSLLGSALLVLWFMTSHTIAAYNINIMLFFPFGFLLIFKKLNSVWLVNTFLVINILWLITAAVITNLYLIGFFLVNLLIWKSLKSVAVQRALAITAK